MPENHAELIELAADIVAAYVANNSVPATDLPVLIASTHAALSGLGNAAVVTPVPEKLVPAVSIRKSITPEAIICLEDGKPFKSLKRHLSSKYGMSPAEYRTKWGLPVDYPMVAPAYAEARSKLAKSMGLGQQRKKTTRRKAA